MWLGFIKRDIPNWDTKPHEPKNPQNWYKVYRKLVQESEREIERDAELLKATLSGIKDASDKNKARQVELAQVRLPPGMIRIGPTIYAKCDLRQPVRTIHNPNEIRAGSDSDSDANMPGFQRRQNARRQDGRGGIRPTKGKLDKFKKEAIAAARFHQNPRQQTGKAVWSAKEMRTGLAPTSGTLTKAPRSMVEEYKRPAERQPLDPNVKLPTIFAPRKRRVEHDQVPQVKKIKTSDVEERERRLKDFTNPASATKGKPASATGSTMILNTKSSNSSSRLPRQDDPSSNHELSKAVRMKELPSHKQTTARASPLAPSRSGITPSSGASTKTHASTYTTTPHRSPSRVSPSVGPTLPSAEISTPSAQQIPPQRLIKRKAPVDVFMRPTRRPRVS